MHLLLIALFVSVVCVPAASAMGAPADPSSEVRAAQRAGWDTVGVLAQAMASSDARRFPGIHAWLKEYRAAGGSLGKRPATAPLPKVDIDRLVTRNASFWRAYFEMVPGDGGTMLLHGALLLAGGEASRAAYILLIARQAPEIEKEILEAMHGLLEHAQRAVQSGAQQVAEAVKLHDDGAPAAAGKRLQALVAAWPGNALAQYELGLALVAQQYVDAGRKPPARSRLSIHSELAPAAAASAAYIRARGHDPLLIRAYQGTETESGDVLMVLGKRVRPGWDSIARDTQGQMPDESLWQLADALQDAGIAELALAVGQVLIARANGYDEDDRKFVAANLRSLAPAAADMVVKRLSQARPEFARLVLP